jgi:hypothetical protein
MGRMPRTPPSCLAGWSCLAEAPARECGARCCGLQRALTPNQSQHCMHPPPTTTRCAAGTARQPLAASAFAPALQLLHRGQPYPCGAGCALRLLPPRPAGQWQPGQCGRRQAAGSRQSGTRRSAAALVFVQLESLPGRGWPSSGGSLLCPSLPTRILPINRTPCPLRLEAELPNL